MEYPTIRHPRMSATHAMTAPAIGDRYIAAKITGRAPSPTLIELPIGNATNLSSTIVIAVQSPMTASAFGVKRVDFFVFFIDKTSFPVLTQKGGFCSDCTTAGCGRKTALRKATSSADNSLFRRHFKRRFFENALTLCVLLC